MGPIPYNVAVATQFPATPAIPDRRYNVQRFNQIVRLAVQISGTPFASQSALMLKANWDDLIAATDETRIILSPPFSNSKITSSKEIQTTPDSNATYRGLPVYFGEGTAMFSAEFQDVDGAVLDAFFDVVAPFTMGSNGAVSNTAVVYLVNNDGMIFSTPAWGGLPCIAFAGRSRGSEGLNSSDKTPFAFYLPPNWDGGTTLPTPTVPTGVGAVDLRTYQW